MKPEDIPSPKSVAKYEIREQEGISKQQSQNATAWINLTQLLEKVLEILDSRDLAEITAMAVTDGDAKLGDAALKENERWKQIFTAAAEQVSAQQRVLEAHRELAKKLIATIQMLRELPSEDALLKRLDRLNASLDELDRHHKSGLLEAVSKL